MTSFPSSEDSFARLKRAGWSVGEAAFVGDTGLVWLVTGANALKAQGRTPAEAWHHACLQARAIGMLGRS